MNERTKELKLKNKRIVSQAKELAEYNNSLNSLNDDLNRANENLEKMVQERTHQLILKNKKLTEYAFINAHNLRVPVANIKGVLQLFEKDRSPSETMELLDMLKEQSQNMDQVLIDIQRMLEQDELLNEEEYFEDKHDQKS